MNISDKMLILVVAHPFLLFFLHLITLRLFPPQSPQKHFFILNAAFQIGWLIGGHLLLQPEKTDSSALPVLLYLFLYSQSVSYAYFHVFNMSETARRIKLLLLMRRGEFDPSVQDSYDINAMVENRIERLTQMKQIKLAADGRLQIQGRFLLTIAKLFRSYKRLLGIKE